MESRPNFYLLLDLPYDPPVEDEATIQQALTNKKVEWGKKRNHPRDAQKIKYYLGLTQQILDVMSDPERRKEEAVEAKELSEREKLKRERATNKKLDGIIKVLSAKGFITNAELASMEKDLKLAQTFIKNRIKVPIKDQHSAKSAATNKPDVLNPEKMKQIVHLLDQLDVEANVGSVPTLYDLLEQPSYANLNDLSKLSQELYQRYQNKGVSSDAAEYKKQLFSIANGIFKSEAEKKKYDHSIQEKRFETVINYIKIASIHGKIDYTVYKELVKQSVNEGLSQDEAKERITSYCQKKGILLLTSDSSNDTNEIELHQCHFCGVVNKKNAVHCSDCGHSLFVMCRNCQTSVENGIKHCTSCGQSFQALIYHDKLLKEGYYFFAKREITEAEECFLKAEYNYRSQEVTAAKQKISTYKNEIQQQIVKIENEIKRNRYYHAEKELLILKKLDQKSLQYSMFEREIGRRLTMTETYLTQAAAATKVNDAVTYYIEALECSADCKRALDKLNQLPPEAPMRVECNVQDESIVISWAASPSEGEIVYRIIRKEGTAPTDANDGLMIGETSSHSFTDKDTEAGKQYFYAIIATRYAATAKHIAHSQSVMRMLEVENLIAKPENGVIKLTWKAPAKAKIEVWKKENGVPEKRGDGIKLNGVTGNEVIDDEVSSDKQYGYLVICQYEDASGKFVLSNGKSVLTMAITIEPIVNLQVKYQQQKVLIKGHENLAGEQFVFLSSTPFTGYKIGDFYLYDQLKRVMNGKRPHSLNQADWVEIATSNQQPIYALPVTKHGNATVIGQQQVLKYIPDVVNVSGTSNQKGELYLKWHWPQDVEQVVVVYSETDYALEPNDAEAVQRHCSKASYEVFNGYKIERITSYKQLFITIYVSEEINGQTVYSEGARYFYTTAKPIEIQYRIEFKGLLKKKKVISIKSSDPTVKSPELLLVKQQGRLPLSKEDGTEVVAVPKGTDLSKYEIDLSVHDERNAYYKLFYADENDRTRFLLEAIGELTTGK